MQGAHLILLVIFFAVFVVSAKILGKYLCKVLDPSGKTFLDPVLKPVERLFYRCAGVDPLLEQNWISYLMSMIVFTCLSVGLTYGVMAAQSWMPFNPQHFPAPSWDLNLNTSVSFATNTNWQSYSGETTMSYFSQMTALTVQNFVSAAVGIAFAAAFVRGIVRKGGTTLGNFWTDLVRVVLYVLLPISIVGAAFFLYQGAPQNLSPYARVETLEGGSQMIAQGPVASQEVIKLLGTNGGGFMKANSMHPYENPTPFSNAVQMFLMLLIPGAQLYYFGQMIRDAKHGWCLFGALGIGLVAGVLICAWSEARLNPDLIEMGIVGGNWEGKELRFGLFESAFYATTTGAVNCGATNCEIGSMMPVGGLIPLLNMQFQDVIFGGAGIGLSSVILHVMLTIFIAGLIVGRTPEYLGQKLEAFEIKMMLFGILAFSVIVHAFASWACLSDWGLSAIGNGGPHGFSEILYAYTSATVNNGSSFAGLSANSLGYNLTLAAAMFLGRVFFFIPVLAIAGAFLGKKILYQGYASFPISNIIFMMLFIGIVTLFGALTFLPALAIGPILEQCAMLTGRLF